VIDYKPVGRARIVEHVATPGEVSIVQTKIQCLGRKVYLEQTGHPQGDMNALDIFEEKVGSLIRDTSAFLRGGPQ
jgi:hypothetical protein